MLGSISKQVQGHFSAEAVGYVHTVWVVKGSQDSSLFRKLGHDQMVCF